MPDIVGDYYLGAKSIVEAQSLVYASTTANSNTVTPGYIISQTPAAGASVAPGSTITVTISLGAATGPLLYDMYQVKEALANNSRPAMAAAGGKRRLGRSLRDSDAG